MEFLWSSRKRVNLANPLSSELTPGKLWAKLGPEPARDLRSGKGYAYRNAPPGQGPQPTLAKPAQQKRQGGHPDGKRHKGCQQQPSEVNAAMIARGQVL